MQQILSKKMPHCYDFDKRKPFHFISFLNKPKDTRKSECQILEQSFSLKKSNLSVKNLRVQKVISQRSTSSCTLYRILSDKDAHTLFENIGKVEEKALIKLIISSEMNMIIKFVLKPFIEFSVIKKLVHCLKMKGKLMKN